ncbi:MAG: hypothetical protein ACYDDS_12115 [Candidatus Sulfotelmatobacter sp.]|jgi:hypothetical protein
MHSSTSNSDPALRDPLAEKTRTRWAIFAVIGTGLLVLLSAEALSRFAFPRISQIEARITSDEREAMSIGAPVPGAPPTVFLVGNSLLLEGLDYPKIRTEMSGEARAVRFVIERTEYLDWYYGLHHMFESGVRPSVVVLCLNLGDTVSPEILGDYSARHLFGASDLLPVARQAGMDKTRTSGLVLAHWSAFYASRATIRNFILNKTDPPYAAAIHALADSNSKPFPPDDELILKAGNRLSAIRQLCRQYGVEFVLLIPPSLTRFNDLLGPAANLQNVDFDYPFPFGTMDAEMFRDRVHLNNKGAALFTDAIVRALRSRLAKRGG